MAKVHSDLEEAGKVISSISRSDLMKAWHALKAVFSRAGIDPDEGESLEVKDDKEVKESDQLSEAQLSMADRSARIVREIKRINPSITYPFIRDLFPEFFVYSSGSYGEGKQIAQYYTLDDKGIVTFGKALEVQSRATYETLTGESLTDTQAEPVEEAGLIDLSSEVIPLIEGAESATLHSVPIRIITAGKGSSGYYSPEVLKRDGPRVFTKGLPMYWNHDSPSQEAERPEGDMDRLAAVLTEDATWNDNGAEGPGLYSRMKVFSDYAAQVKEKAPHTGLSIKALGKARTGEIPGVGKVPIVEAIVKARSVDFVTKAGAGGKAFIPLQESATEGDPTMSDQQPGAPNLSQLEEIIKQQATQLQSLQESIERGKAAPIIDRELSSYGLPSHAIQKIRPALIAGVQLKEGAIDEAMLKEAVKVAAEAEATYLASMGLGRVQGMGGSGSRELSEADPAAYMKRIDDKIKGLNG